MDVVLESDPPPSTERGGRVSPPFTIHASDIEALRRGVARATESDAPESRPSLPVRAGRAAKSKSPWIVVGMLVIELARYALEHLL